MKSKTIAIVAVCSAIAVICAIIANYSPINIVPVAGCSFVFSLAYKKCGWVAGLICEFVSIALVLLICSISATSLFLLILFAPYSILAHALKGITYTKKTAWIRILIMLAFFFATALSVFLLCSALSLQTLPIVENWGIYLVSLAIGVLCLPMDYLFDGVSNYVCSRIK